MGKGRKNITLTWLETVNDYNRGYILDLTDNLKAICEVAKESERSDIEAFSLMSLKLVEGLNEGVERINKAIDFCKEELKKGNLKLKENGN